ncbi:MAG TPA: tRNA 2-thiouridine(34) synthase MnmA [Candidatus Paceibacterota bacterium]|nr:tRNA 2-thiouridine(34) synthase MnmA [Candidatus Paceibacterota bacterium]
MTGRHIAQKAKKIEAPKRVFVGMSGGVDSSVSAALLKEAGYEVIGVFIKVWSPDWLPCDWREERRDAMRCAAILEIPLLTLNLEKEYKEEVVDYMIREYKAGRVPNPDVMCNRSVKFGGFFNEAMKMGADYVATGHYAQTRIKNYELRITNEKIKKYELLAGEDRNKDQSYFLWTLKQEQLSKTLFPVGGLKKEEVRKLAEKFGLPTATKKDSQGLCFLGKIDVKDFLKRYINAKEGKVLNEKGKVVGHHDGAVLYTIGERHGFAIDNKKPDDAPYYIVGKDIKKNTITVSHNKASGNSAEREIEISDLSFTLGEAPVKNKKYSARIRYREDLKKCEIKKISPKKATIVFDEPEESVSAGQSLVLYDGDICLGGGVIIG